MLALHLEVADVKCVLFFARVALKKALPSAVGTGTGNPQTTKTIENELAPKIMKNDVFK